MNPLVLALGEALLSWLSSRTSSLIGETAGKAWSGANQSFGTQAGLPTTQLDQLPVFAMQSAIRFQNAQLSAFSQTGSGFGKGTDGIEKMTKSLESYRKALENAGVSQRDFAEKLVVMSASSLKVGKALVSATNDAVLFSQATGIDLGTIQGVERSVRAGGVSAVGLGSGIQRIAPGMSSPQVGELMSGIGSFEKAYAAQGIGTEGGIQTALAALAMGNAGSNPAFKNADSLTLAQAFLKPDLESANPLMMAFNPLKSGQGLYEWNLEKNKNLIGFNKNYLKGIQGMGGNAAMQATGLPAGVLEALLDPKNLALLQKYDLSNRKDLEEASAVVTGTQARVGAQSENSIRGLGDPMLRAFDQFARSTHAYETATGQFVAVAEDIFTKGRAGNIGVRTLMNHPSLLGPPDLGLGGVFKSIGRALTPKEAGAEEATYSSAAGYRFKAGVHIKQDSLGDLAAQLLIAKGLKDIIVTDEFRTGAEQDALIRRGRSFGHSPHQDGNAIDLSLKSATKAQLQAALGGISGLDVRVDDHDHWHIGPKKGASQEEIARIMVQLTQALNSLHSSVQRSALPADSTTVRRSGR